MAVLFQLEQSQWWSPARIWEHQRGQLETLLRHAAGTSPFYLRPISAFLDRHAGFSPEAFASLPILTRRDLQQHHGQIASRRVPQRHGQVTSVGTSGSTGEPVMFQTTDLVNFFWQAFNLRDHLWHKRDLSRKLATIRVGLKAGVMPNWFGDVGDTTLETGPCVLIPAELPIGEQAESLVAEDPAYITGYTRNLIGILERIHATGGQLPSLQQVRSFGEAVTDEDRRYVRELWRASLVDMYTTREAGYIALQCPDGEGYHIQSEGVYVEVLAADGTPCRPGETGRVVVTPLHNFAFPMIRYDLQDYAEVGDRCSCGRGLPVIRRIYGRSRNLMKLRDGNSRWPALGTPELRQIAPVRQFQVVQQGYDDLDIWICAERELTEDEIHRLGAHFRSYLGHPFRVQWRFVAEIPRNAGLKFEDFTCAF